MNLTKYDLELLKSVLEDSIEFDRNALKQDFVCPKDEADIEGQLLEKIRLQTTIKQELGEVDAQS